MSGTDDQTLEGGAVESEAVETLVDDSTDTTNESGESSSGDPLDDIKDPVERAEAKKNRAIARRLSKKDPEKPEKAPATSDPVAKLITFEAKKLVPDEVKAVWEDLYNIPLGGYDAHDPESIAKNMQQRYVIFRQDNPVAKEDQTKDFTTDSGIRGSSPKTNDTGEKEKPLPGLREAKQPEDWYPVEK